VTMQIVSGTAGGGNLENHTLGVLLHSLQSFIGPRFGFGHCLAPKYPSGTLFWIDPTRTPQNGDLVWYHWPEAWCEHLRKTYGITVTGGAKYFRTKGGKTFLESNEGMVPYKPDEWIIEGVVVGTFTFRHPPAVLAELIARADADIAEAEKKQQELKARTPLDDLGAVRYKGGRA
jgi:hypothetical protein